MARMVVLCFNDFRFLTIADKLFHLVLVILKLKAAKDRFLYYWLTKHILMGSEGFDLIGYFDDEHNDAIGSIAAIYRDLGLQPLLT